ncbi:MAG: tyrosine-type recombinase/integrase [Candidatus Bathyarchaeia archaeon]
MASRECPNCHSKKIWKDGLREISTGYVQRFLCRECGFRFSIPSKTLNLEFTTNGFSQLCAELEAKKLETTQKNKFCVGDIKKVDAETKGLLIQFYAFLEKEAYSTESDYVDKVKHLAVLGANLRDPESVKTTIGQMKRKDGQKTKNGTKMLYCYAYDAFAKMLKISWNIPKYSQEDFVPFVPDETELDALINSAKSNILATFLQCLKETFGDPGEVLRIKKLDVDLNNKTISIRYPVKNHLPRTLTVSNRLLAMIDALPKKLNDDRIFPTNYSNMLRRFVVMRKRTAEIQQNPRLLAVDFTAFRTWAGTMIAYHTNGNVLTVKKLLGHKQVKNTMKYIGNIEFRNDDFDTTSATTVEDILRLGKEGWIEYSVVKVSTVEYHCFKKPKRFSSYV